MIFSVKRLTYLFCKYPTVIVEIFIVRVNGNLAPGSCISDVFLKFPNSFKPLAVVTQKGESQNGCDKKTKPTKFSEKGVKGNLVAVN